MKIGSKNNARTPNYECIPGRTTMDLLLLIILWLLVFAVSPVIAIAAIVLFPIVWLLSIPFRLLGFAVDGVLQFVRGLVLLPARLVGMRPRVR